MKEEIVRSILRIIAVVTVLVGAILLTIAVVQLLAAGRGYGSSGGGIQVHLSGMVWRFGFFTVLAYGSVVFWGGVLFFLSPRLARLIVE